MMFFFKGRSVIVDPPVPASKPEISVSQPLRNNARARLRLEEADTSGAIRRDRQTLEDNSLL